ncbi:hypothetical protein Tco_1553324, partial [Tanacetum coccineum]
MGKLGQEQEEWALGYISPMFQQVLQMRASSRRCMMDWPKMISNMPNEPPLREDKVTSLEDEILKHKRRMAVIDSSKDEGPSLDAMDSPKHGRMIEEIYRDKTINLVKSRELGKSYDTVEHRMESEHEDDDDDTTLAETLLNIKRSAAKGKAIMQESEPPK